MSDPYQDAPGAAPGLTAATARRCWRTDRYDPCAPEPPESNLP